MSNISTDILNQARTTLDQSQEVVIMLGKNPTLDQVASGLALYLAMSAKGKRVIISCPDPMTVEFNQLIGVDKITGNTGNSGNGKNLVISFPYQEGSIEKVSYNIENDTFNLVIEPREGYPQITQDLIRFGSSGGNTDLILTIGIPNYNYLESLFPNAQELSNKNLINIDTDSSNQSYGKFNLVDVEVTSISELLTLYLSQLGLNIDSDIAGNLYAGIIDGSSNFTSPKTSAMTFESAAVCLRKGAGKQPVSSRLSQPPNNSQMYSQPQPGRSYNNPPKPNLRLTDNFKPSPKSFSPQMGFGNQPPKNKPMNFTPSQGPKPPSQSQPLQSAKPQQQVQTQAPPDWLKPKIYKGSTLL